MAPPLKKILIKARRQVFTEIMGNNASLFLGEGYDFAELREYQIGDDVRKIDWIISAKLHHPYVKLFHAERELHAAVACMLSGSVYFGTVRPKQELIAEISAILGFSAIKNSDLFSSYLFADTLYHTSQPSKSHFAIQSATEKILQFDPLGKEANYQEMAKELLSRIKRRSLVFIIADCFEPIDFRVLAKKHEVILIIVRDRFEENPQALGYVSMVDPESGQRMEGDMQKGMTESYRKKIAAQDAELYAQCRRQGIHFTKIYTDEDPFIKLLKLFQKGRPHG